MINMEGFKAFRWAMCIIPKTKNRPPYQLYGEWLYKPGRDCWYSGGRSFPAEVCEVAEGET